MSYLLDNLPRFRRIPTVAEVTQAELQPNAYIVAEDSEQLFVDTPDKRIDLSSIKHITDKRELPEVGSASKLYIAANGSMYAYTNGTWCEYTPYPMSDATYMHRFVVSEDTETLRFSKDVLGLKHNPEMDVLDGEGYNISTSDFMSRRWDGDEYVITYSGGWPKGEYFLKISYNVRYDSQGIYITDADNTEADINVAAGEHYVFEQPLTSLNIDLVTGCKGECTVWFKTGTGFSLSIPESIRFFDNPPEFMDGNEYVLIFRNNTVAVGLLAK